MYYWVIQTVILHHRTQQRKTEESFLAYQKYDSMSMFYVFYFWLIFGRRVENIKISHWTQIYEQSTVINLTYHGISKPLINYLSIPFVPWFRPTLPCLLIRLLCHTITPKLQWWWKFHILSILNNKRQKIILFSFFFNCLFYHLDKTSRKIKQEEQKISSLVREFLFFLLLL